VHNLWGKKINFDYAAFSFTRVWIVGLFREQAQGWFVKK
jgi:hypothetical protein